MASTVYERETCIVAESIAVLRYDQLHVFPAVVNDEHTELASLYLHSGSEWLHSQCECFDLS